ncbi:ParB/RepB/Spo0J family partition protein [Amycolatopsis sp. NPDC059021]|uniref:ParB/RepB/Spo0J family partition protein n=1 Tax=Amycolatopsis sp. NPDC059021 TaxID=3346704 RepID=UPI00366EBC7E
MESIFHGNTSASTEELQYLAVRLGSHDDSSIATENVSLSQLRPADSPRSGYDDNDHIRSLAESDCTLPPIVVHRPTMRIIDGTYRTRAASLRGETCVQVRFFEGSIEEAFVLAVELNSRHGLPLSRTERSTAATRIVRSYPHWSNTRIAAVCGISDKTVAAIRRRSTSEFPALNGRVGQDGRVRPIDPAHGRLRASKVLAERPNASLREVSQAAGISLATARDVRERLRQGEDPVPVRLRRTKKESHQGDPQRSGAFESRSRSTTQMSAERYADIMGTLRRDPSLRFTDAGRTTLRLLDVHTINDDCWEYLAANIPSHCSHAVADAARRCIDIWSRFIDQLESRSADNSGHSPT